VREGCFMAFNWFKTNKTDDSAAKSAVSDIADETLVASPDSDKPAEKESKGIFQRLKNGLSKTRQILNTDIDRLFTTRRKLDDDLLEELEEMLITSDIGIQTTQSLIDRLSRHKESVFSGTEELKALLKSEILGLMGQAQAVATESGKPHVILVVGVNGVGKTTTIGKLAAMYARDGKRVLIAAGDTFRAAAAEQLAIWAERSGADIVRHKANSDPAAVAYDAMEAAIARNMDIVLVDTAGRLHTRVNLMEELKKIKKAIARKLPDAPHETLLILDATTGQNALSQAKLFHESIDISGIALTKLDGTAKGGVVISICHTMNIPLTYIGVGEAIDDLQRFDAAAFVNALF